MNDLYAHYYEEHLSRSDSQRLDVKSFGKAVRKYRWNYGRFFHDLPRDAAILDVGSGVGQFLFYLHGAGYRNLVGIDISAEMIRLARTMQPALDWRQVGSSETFLKDHPNAFDVIVLNDVLEHIQPEALVPMGRALLAALRPGGRLIVKTINAAYPLGSSARYQDLTHRIAFHEKALHQLLNHCGFARIECLQEEIGIYNPLFAVKKGIVWAVRLLLRLLVYFSEGGWPRIISPNILCTARKDRHA